MNNLESYFNNLNENNLMTQSFLIGNILLSDIKDSLLEVIQKIIFKSSNSYENNPDIIILEANPSKDDIKELIKNLSMTSQFNNAKVYIIDQAEKLNDFACNALLKTLEEPQSNIYAFLLTSNIDMVLPTISSRCQKVFISSGKIVDVNEEYLELSNSLIEDIETLGFKTISVKKDIYNEINERDIFKRILINILCEYEKNLRMLIKGEKENNIILNNNSIESISKKILIISDNINRLDSPLNKALSIDRFIIEMWRC